MSSFSDHTAFMLLLSEEKTNHQLISLCNSKQKFKNVSHLEGELDVEIA